MQKSVQYSFSYPCEVSQEVELVSSIRNSLFCALELVHSKKNKIPNMQSVRHSLANIINVVVLVADNSSSFQHAEVSLQGFLKIIFDFSVIYNGFSLLWYLHCFPVLYLGYAVYPKHCARMDILNACL